MRRNLQHSAMGSGVLLQNLGSLLLELGRTTMMLRISPAPSEAVVNAGPAVFISPSGPNPLMVPPVPFFPGTRSVHMGTIFSGFSSQGSLPHPRDIDIHVRTSGPVTVASTNPSELAGAQQAQEHTDRTGNGSHANISEAFAGAMGGAPFAVESGVRVLPLRTVVAVPAGISRPPSGSSSGGVGLIYPLLTRIQQRANVNGSDTRNGQSPNEPTNNGIHANQHLILQPSSQAHEAGNLEPPIDTNLGNSSQTPSVQHNGQGPLSQLLDRLHLIGSLFSGENVQGNGTTQQASMAGSAEQVDARNAGTAEASGVSDEGLRFSYLVQQIMPFISQGGTAAGQSAPVDSISTPPQAASESLNSELDGSNDSRSPQQHQRDPPENPNSKRQRTSE